MFITKNRLSGWVTQLIRDNDTKIGVMLREFDLIANKLKTTRATLNVTDASLAYTIVRLNATITCALATEKQLRDLEKKYDTLLDYLNLHEVKPDPKPYLAPKQTIQPPLPS